MKKIIFLIPIILLFSCKTIKQVLKEDVQIKKGGVTKFEMIGNGIILTDDKIDNKSAEYPFLFDTGTTSTLITDTTIIDNFSRRDFASFGSIKVPNDKKIKKKTVNIDFENSLFKAKNLYVPIVNIDSISCANSVFDGIIGVSQFNGGMTEKIDPSILEINFDENKIKILPKDFDKAGFEIVNSVMKKINHFYILLEINGIKDYYLFDTGNGGNIIVNSKIVKLDNLSPSSEREGINHFTAAGLDKISIKKTYKNVDIFIGKEKGVSDVEISTSISNANVGMDFIRQFNWILDWKNKKIYAQKRENYKRPENKILQDYIVLDQKDKLLVLNKSVKATKYNVGDEIISVNGEKVTPENICEMQSMLNKTEEWNTLKLEIRK